MGVALACLALITPAGAQGDIGNERTTVLQQQAQRAVETQQFAQGVPALAELNRRFRGSEDPAIVQVREGILYYLGLGYMQAMELVEAEKTMREFLEDYPKGRNTIFARLYLGDAVYYQNKLSEARAVYDELRRGHDLTALEPRQRVGFWDKLSDCYFAALEWRGGVEVFEGLAAAAGQQFDAELANEKRAKAASYLLQAAIATDDMRAALAILPRLSEAGGGALYDLSLNLALMRGGDQLYDSNRYSEALFFYQQVLGPQKLATYWQKMIAELEVAVARVAGVPMLAGRFNELSSRRAIAQARWEQIRTSIGGLVPDYTGALRFRIARCYLVRGRNYEAYWAFARLRETEEAKGSAAELVEDALYCVIKTASAVQRMDRARSAAVDYLGNTAFRRFVGDVGFELMRMAQAEGDDAVVARLAGLFLDRVRAQPDLEEAPKLVFLAGSNLIALDDLPALRAQFEPFAAQFPESSFTDGALYWLGLAAIFEGDFDNAMGRFERIIEVFPRGSYAEDARYRLGGVLFW